MIVVKGEARFGEGEIERLREALKVWIEEVRQRDGCRSYGFAQDLSDPDILHVFHSWRDLAALDAHMADLGSLLQVLAGTDMPSLNVAAYEAKFIKLLMG